MSAPYGFSLLMASGKSILRDYYSHSLSFNRETATLVALLPLGRAVPGSLTGDRRGVLQTACVAASGIFDTQNPKTVNRVQSSTWVVLFLVFLLPNTFSGFDSQY